MKKIVCAVLTGFFLILGSVAEGKVREAQVAGRYYPKSSPILRDKVDEFVDEVKGVPILGRIVALIVPHAGYDISGKVAAHGYKELFGRRFDTVILVGPSHHRRFRGVSVWDRGLYITPLGKVHIDSRLARAIVYEDPMIFFDPEVHLGEHSIEVQLPFIQRVCKDVKIVPILMGDQSRAFCEILSDAIYNAIKKVAAEKRILLIASTDLSHYYYYTKAKRIDKYTISVLEKMDPQRLIIELEKEKVEMCGGGCVAVVMDVAKRLGADRIKILKYLTSGDVTGRMFRVVGYTSAILYATDKLDKDAQAELLRIARTSIKEYLEKGRPPSFEPVSPFLKQERGAFVTLEKKGKLRGCIGYIYPVKPLWEVVRDAAIKAATRDFRFKPVAKRELPHLKIEISVLSPLEKIEDISLIKPGIHGLFVTKGWQEGLLLPQVAKRMGWGRERFLEEACRKAGLKKDAYKRREVSIYIFEAQVFSEE